MRLYPFDEFDLVAGSERHDGLLPGRPAALRSEEGHVAPGGRGGLQRPDSHASIPLRRVRSCGRERASRRPSSRTTGGPPIGGGSCSAGRARWASASGFPCVYTPSTSSILWPGASVTTAFFQDDRRPSDRRRVM